MIARLVTLLLALPAQQASDAQIALWVATDLRKGGDGAPAESRLHEAGLFDDLTLAREVSGKLVSAGGAGVVVGVHEGDVTLNGHVSDAAQKTKLTSLAAGVAGVRSVDDQLLLPGQQPAPQRVVVPAADTKVEGQAGPAVTDPFDFLTPDGFAGRGMRVDVDQGLVTLTGEVSSTAARLFAAGVAGRVPGVRIVRNTCSVHPSSGIGDRGTALLVERVFQWDVLVQRVSSLILVSCDHGVVRLSGHVRDEGQRARCEELARAQDVVFAVDNRLVVDEDLVPPANGIPGFQLYRRN
ncbi:MAG TPA: BON domain-containing protein [Planctomycetota bacterium]|nr:BON domain-containing protein [Planctomycetota bacterium]